MANGGDTSGDVDGITEPGAVTLRASNGVYPSEGVLTTAAADCNLSGTGRVSVTSEYISGTTAVSLMERLGGSPFGRETGVPQPGVYPVPGNADYHRHLPDTEGY